VAFFGSLRKTTAVALIGAAAVSAFGPARASAQNGPLNVGTWGPLRNNDMPISGQARIVARFTMTEKSSIVYKINYSDPIIFTLPWSARVDWKRNEKYEIFEYARHEGNVQIRGLHHLVPSPTRSNWGGT
jgi:hypothetical protein